MSRLCSLYSEVTEYIWISHRYLILSQNHMNWGSPFLNLPFFQYTQVRCSSQNPRSKPWPLFLFGLSPFIRPKAPMILLAKHYCQLGEYLLKEQDRPHLAHSSDLTLVEGPVCVRAEGIWSKKSEEPSAVIWIWPCLSWPSRSSGARRIPFWAEVPRS